jgi:hypothetical protein
MGVAQWIELSVGALGNEGIPKFAGCLNHQLQHWAHFEFFLSVSQHSNEFLCVCPNRLSSVLDPTVTRGL